MKIKPRLLVVLLVLIIFNIQHCAVADPYAEATVGKYQVVSPVYFGVHFHRLVVLPTERAVPTQWPRMSFGAVRLWDTVTRWGNITPSAGVWDFERMDTFVNAGVNNKAEVLYTLGSTPQWASARPNEKCPYGFGCGAESVRIAHWEEYVRRVAQRYGDRIQAYELWNEPYFSDFPRDIGRPGFFTGSVQQMVSMAASARKILDEVSPHAKLCTPGFVNGPDRLEKFLADGGKQYVQAICYHFYAEGTDHFIKQVNEVRAIMRRQGVEKLPLWNTETGVDTLMPDDPPSGIAARSRDEAMARLNQLLILGAAVGMERFYYYAWDNTRSGVVSPNGDKLLGYDALQRTQSWLIGTRFEGCKSTSTLVTCEAVKEQTRYIYAWAKKPVASTIPIPAGYRVSAGEKLLGAPLQLSDAASKGQEAMRFDAIPIRFQLVSK